MPWSWCGLAMCSTACSHQRQTLSQHLILQTRGRGCSRRFSQWCCEGPQSEISEIKHMSLFSLKKLFRPNLTRHDFYFCLELEQEGGVLVRWSWAEQELPLSFRDTWIDVQQSRESPGNLWASTPLADICFASSVWGGWFSFAPHLFPIKSYKTPIKMVTKQKFSQVQLDWNFLYQFCHLQRLPHTQQGGGNVVWFILVVLAMLLSAALMKWELLSSQVALPWSNPTCGQGGEVPCAVLRISCSPLVQHWKWKPWNACKS